MSNIWILGEFLTICFWLREDLKQRKNNIEQATATIADCNAQINELEGSIKGKEQEVDALETVYKEKHEEKESRAEKVRQREKIISTLQTGIRTYNDAQAKWNEAKAKVEQFLTFVGMCAYQDVDPVSGRRMRMLYQVPPTKTPLVAPSKAVRDLASKPSPATQLAQASKHNYPVGSAGHETGCAYIDPQGGDYRGLADVDGLGRPCLPWPKDYALKYAGSGLAKDMTEVTNSLNNPV
jgi:hypothetical protein